MGLTTREAAAEFADLVYTDPQWLREEFDALIATSFGRPPAAPPPAPPGLPRRGPSCPPAGQASRRLPAACGSRPCEHAQRRQRSPPP
jgi:hypothetical protein